MIETAVRPKRVSTRCVAKTERQLKLLEEAYENDTRPDETAFEAHATETGLDVAQVKRWVRVVSILLRRVVRSAHSSPCEARGAHRPTKRRTAGMTSSTALRSVKVL